MPRRIPLGNLFGLELAAAPAALAWAALLAIVFALVGILLGLSVFEAVVGALVCVAIHYGSELLHQLGHAVAARRTGHPMRGVRYVSWLAFSVYPENEPPLSGRVHIRRALGGPLASFGVTLFCLVLVLASRAWGELAFLIALFAFLDNLLVFSIGSLVPLSFNDGGSIRHWWGKP